jgi:glycosyltransferase involved in cell wall biosynthesis
MSTALISVIIPYYNARRWLPEAVQSVIDQHLSGVEIIVVDDGSPDGGPADIVNTWPDVRLLRSQHGGPSRARNVGTLHTHGQYIQYLDADDLLAPGKLATQLTALEETGVDVAYGAWQRLTLQPDGSFVVASWVDRTLSDTPEIDLFTDFWCPPAVYLFRRSIVEKVGGWNERLPVIQDARFALDCALRQGRFIYCDGIMASYRTHASASVSTKNPVAFVQDCFRNATEVERWWRNDGELNEAQRKALQTVYSTVVKASFAKDTSTYEAAYHALKMLGADYDLGHFQYLIRASRVFGARNIAALACGYRRVRQLFRGSPAVPQQSLLTK